MSTAHGSEAGGATSSWSGPAPAVLGSPGIPQWAGEPDLGAASQLTVPARSCQAGSGRSRNLGVGEREGGYRRRGRERRRRSSDGGDRPGPGSRRRERRRRWRWFGGGWRWLAGGNGRWPRRWDAPPYGVPPVREGGGRWREETGETGRNRREPGGVVTWPVEPRVRRRTARSDAAISSWGRAVGPAARGSALKTHPQLSGSRLRVQPRPIPRLLAGAAGAALPFLRPPIPVPPTPYAGRRPDTAGERARKNRHGVSAARDSPIRPVTATGPRTAGSVPLSSMSRRPCEPVIRSAPS